MEDRLRLAKSLSDSEPDEALRICNEIMNEDITGVYGEMALFMSGYIMMNAERYGLAYHIYKRCAEAAPHVSETWSNMGMCLEEQDPDEALKCFKKAESLNDKNFHALANQALIYLQKGNPRACIDYCDKALKISECKAARHNKSLAQLMLRKWDKGWQGYSDTLGVKHREIQDYGLPMWDGKAPGRVLVYGEQGVGDEVMFATCLEDLQKTNEVSLNTDSRLKGLFSRTFDFPVYGERFNQHLDLNEECDYQFPIGNLPALYRRKESDFPGNAYLKPDPERVIQWSSLFDTFKGKKIGIAWNGGLLGTGQKKRSIQLSDMAPVFDDENTYISLEYKDADPAELALYGIKSYPRATGKGKDIDELAALVASLDYVVSCCTSVIYIAGALGVPCYVLVPSEPSYRYHLKGDFPWFNSVELIRQKNGETWKQTINENIHRLRPSGSSGVSRLMPFNSETIERPSIVHAH